MTPCRVARTGLDLRPVDAEQRRQPAGHHAGPSSARRSSRVSTSAVAPSGAGTRTAVTWSSRRRSGTPSGGPTSRQRRREDVASPGRRQRLVVPVVVHQDGDVGRGERREQGGHAAGDVRHVPAEEQHLLDVGRARRPRRRRQPGAPSRRAASSVQRHVGKPGRGGPTTTTVGSRERQRVRPPGRGRAAGAPSRSSSALSTPPARRPAPPATTTTPVPGTRPIVLHPTFPTST